MQRARDVVLFHFIANIVCRYFIQVKNNDVITILDGVTVLKTNFLTSKVKITSRIDREVEEKSNRTNDTGCR